MNGIVSGKVVNKIAEFGEIKEFNVTGSLLSDFWINTIFVIATTGFAVPIGFTFAYCDNQFYESYRPKCYMTVEGNKYYNPCKDIVIRLEANGAQQFSPSATMTFQGYYLEFDPVYKFTITTTKLMQLNRYTITF